MATVRAKDATRVGRLRAVFATAAGLIGLKVGFIAGALVALVRRNRAVGMAAAVPLACRWALRMAGVRVRVHSGAEYLTQARPAVFIANHQSAIDPLVVGCLLRRDFTVVGKKEARHDPRALIGALLFDPVFIDTLDSARAKDELRGQVDRIREGTSIMMFPEGKRQHGRYPGSFKKGALHLAMQAGVPLVPIVLRNTGDLMGPASKLVWPGTVDVVVLEPISTDGWGIDDVDEHVRDIRDVFVRTFDAWGARGPGVQS